MNSSSSPTWRSKSATPTGQSIIVRRDIRWGKRSKVDPDLGGARPRQRRRQIKPARLLRHRSRFGTGRRRVLYLPSAASSAGACPRCPGSTGQSLRSTSKRFSRCSSWSRSADGRRSRDPFPTFLKIQDVARRVMEFLLDLDVGKIRRRRTELRNAISTEPSPLDAASRRPGRHRSACRSSQRHSQLADRRVRHYRPNCASKSCATVNGLGSMKRSASQKLAWPSWRRRPSRDTEAAVPEMLERLEVVRTDIDG